MTTIEQVPNLMLVGGHEASIEAIDVADDEVTFTFQLLEHPDIVLSKSCAAQFGPGTELDAWVRNVLSVPRCPPDWAFDGPALVGRPCGVNLTLVRDDKSGRLCSEITAVRGARTTRRKRAPRLPWIPEPPPPPPEPVDELAVDLDNVLARLGPLCRGLHWLELLRLKAILGKKRLTRAQVPDSVKAFLQDGRLGLLPFKRTFVGQVGDTAAQSLAGVLNGACTRVEKRTRRSWLEDET